MNKLSIIVPCYNEMDSVDEFYKQVKMVLDDKKIDYELMMIDDGSGDNTLEKLSLLAKEDKNVKVIGFSRNFGKEAAMLAGLENVTGDYIALMDADLQHRPAMMVEMYEKLLDNKGYDVVAAYKEKRDDEPALKRSLTSMFYKLSNGISDVRMLPGASDFRVFKSYVKDAIISLPDKRTHGKSKWSLIKLIKYSLGGIVSFSTLPIKSVFIISILVFLTGLINFILMGNLSHRTIILFISIIMLSLGIMSLYISRIYTNILNRPAYIIKEKIGFKTKTTK